MLNTFCFVFGMSQEEDMVIMVISSFSASRLCCSQIFTCKKTRITDKRKIKKKSRKCSLYHIYNTNINPEVALQMDWKWGIAENWDGRIKGQSVNGRAKKNLMRIEQNQSKNGLKSVSTLVTGSTDLFMEGAGIALLKWHSFWTKTCSESEN